MRRLFLAPTSPSPGLGGGSLRMFHVIRFLRERYEVDLLIPALADGLQRIYDPGCLANLLAPLTVLRIEYAWSRAGLWIPCSEAETASVDWTGPARAVAMVIARKPEG